MAGKSKYLFRWLKGERVIVGRIYFLALMQGIMYVAIPLGIQGIITFIMAGRFSASLLLLSAITIAVTVFIGFFQVWQLRINETLHQKLFSNLSTRLNLMLNEDASSGKNLWNINKFNEISTLQKGISGILLEYSFSVISIIFGLLLLPLYSPWFLIFTILLGLTFYFILTFYGRKGVESNYETSDEKYQLLDYYQKKVINADKETDTSIVGEELLQNYLSKRNAHYRILETQFKGIVIFKVLFVSILLLFGAFLVQRGDINIGQFIASEIIILLVLNAVEKLIGGLSTAYDIITATYKLERIFDAKSTFSFISRKPAIAFKGVYSHRYSRVLKMLLLALFGAGFITLFMPWTQNVEAVGKVTTLDPENRPQAITSRIGGRIEKWYINEGDLVQKDDTIAYISEIKDEYIDPRLIERSESQIKAKETTLQQYLQKISAVDSQIDALNRALKLKMEQARNKIIQAKIKVTTDSIEAQTVTSNFKVAEDQLKRYEGLFLKDVISKTDLENRRIKLQESLAKKTNTDNKFISTKNELLNTEIEINAIQQDYQEKLMKAESEKFSALSMLYEGEGALTKLQNQLSNYTMRQGFYFVLAPQDGYITKTFFQGIGEIVKEGAPLCNIVPEFQEQTVELYINPVDLPLIEKGQTVQLVFDGWPAFVFSGWPGVSYGSYSATVVAFDKVLSDNGKFRILAKQTGPKWPSAIQQGGGVKGFALLNDVPVIYEFWRNINGFPPEFYASITPKPETSEKK